MNYFHAIRVMIHDIVVFSTLSGNAGFLLKCKNGNSLETMKWWNEIHEHQIRFAAFCALVCSVTEPSKEIINSQMKIERLN